MRPVRSPSSDEHHLSYSSLLLLGIGWEREMRYSVYSLSILFPFLPFPLFFLRLGIISKTIVFFLVNEIIISSFAICQKMFSFLAATQISLDLEVNCSQIEGRESSLSGIVELSSVICRYVVVVANIFETRAKNYRFLSLSLSLPPHPTLAPKNTKLFTPLSPPL